MSVLVGHITAGGFSRSREPACLSGALVWLLQNKALGVTRQPEPLHLSMYLEKFNASKTGDARLVKHLAYCFWLFKKKKK